MKDSARTLVYEGSSRYVYRVAPGVLDFDFLDTFSCFDVGQHHQEIPGKGVALCACAVQSFKIARQLGIDTHFIGQIDADCIRVQEFQILEPAETSLETTGHILPLELIDGSCVAGSLGRDFKSGKKKPMDFGFETNDSPADGTPLFWPEQRYTTKREEYDRPLTPQEARDLARITEVEEDRLWRIIHRLNGGLSLVAAMAGFTRFDGKKEVGLVGPRRRPIILDTFGTLDEDRFAPTAALREGEIIHFSKEMIREIFIANGYYDALMIARKNGQPDPPYPDLTPEQITEVSWRYHQFAEAYCSVKLGDVPGLG
ncbi:MAG: phosphoribosylaminoimidazolesuccinocarboxamide synthase [Patescibacteria group bacterium]